MFTLAINTIKTTTISQNAMHRFIGVHTILLPLILVLGTAAFSTNSAIQPSLSHYYYTSMSFFFIGSLGLFSAILFFSETKSKGENFWSKCASLCALGTACLPTMAVGAKLDWINILHLTFALTLFLALSILSMVYYFRNEKNSIDIEPQFRSNYRARVYRFGGLGIVLSLITLVLYFAITISTGGTTVNSYTVFGIEIVIILIVGIIWLVKGGAIKNK
jgi:hypothetical protein